MIYNKTKIYKNCLLWYLRIQLVQFNQSILNKTCYKFTVRKMKNKFKIKTQLQVGFNHKRTRIFIKNRIYKVNPYFSISKMKFNLNKIKSQKKSMLINNQFNRLINLIFAKNSLISQNI